MDNWKNININGIIKLEKCVAEFNVWEQIYTPYGKFKVKIYEDNKNKYSGFSNLHIADDLGNYDCAVGHGSTIEETLENTIKDLFQMLSRKESEQWIENDFKCSETFDF